MYFQIGKPRKISSFSTRIVDSDQLKREYEIAVVDDNPFAKVEPLRSHNFRIAELGDIKRIEQVAAYPIIVCDIRGVGTSFDSALEGAHVLAEIRKKYPDKFLIAYSGAESDMGYNDSLRSADLSISKDSITDVWVQHLENGLKEVGHPFRRWIRFRTQLSMRGAEAHDIFNLEQNFIKSMEEKDASILEKIKIPPEIRQLVTEFAKIAVPQLIKLSIGSPVP